MDTTVVTDPFADNAAIEDASSQERDLVASSTLAVGRNATLTLGTDSLILLDEGLYDSSRARCCGLVSDRTFLLTGTLTPSHAASPNC
jgi:hypothetical protein